MILFFAMDCATLDILKQKDLQPAEGILERILGTADQWVWLPSLSECTGGRVDRFRTVSRQAKD